MVDRVRQKKKFSQKKNRRKIKKKNWMKNKEKNVENVHAFVHLLIAVDVLNAIVRCETLQKHKQIMISTSHQLYAILHCLHTIAPCANETLNKFEFYRNISSVERFFPTYQNNFFVIPWKPARTFNSFVEKNNDFMWEKQMF